MSRNKGADSPYNLVHMWGSSVATVFSNLIHMVPHKCTVFLYGVGDTSICWHV